MFMLAWPFSLLYPHPPCQAPSFLSPSLASPALQPPSIGLDSKMLMPGCPCWSVWKDAPCLAPSFLSPSRSEEHTSELQSLRHLVCRLLLEKKKTRNPSAHSSAKLNIT